VYEHLRPLLFSIAYRMVGSASDAEDIVQEAFLRFHRESSNGAEIESPKAWLSTVTTRLAINHVQSARVRRETYIGTWLPEPLITDTELEGARQAETADSLSLAFLVLLESLGPVERAVFHISRPSARLSLSSMRHVEVNGQPGALFVDPEGRPVLVVSLDIVDGLVQTVRGVSNPDKLRHLDPDADPRPLSD
jgi:RNA polymerase sigma factor (sigma-70 family)